MTKKVKGRSLLLGGLFTLFFIALVGRVYWVQVVESPWLLAAAKEKWETDKEIKPVRGQILDRNNKVMAEDAPAYTVALAPQIIIDRKVLDETVKGLADILKISDDPKDIAALEDKIRTRINTKNKDGNLLSQIEIRNEGWKIDAEVADKVRQLAEDLKETAKARDPKGVKPKTTGIYLLEDQKRFYPGGKLASHLLGYSDKEGKAVTGLEAAYDKVLSGTPGFLSYQKDQKGVELPDSKAVFQPAIDGSNVRLTIDKNIQFYMENALDKMQEKYHPKGMMAIAADPKTMEILGMVSYPNYNPNKYWETKAQSDFINHNIASQYEPGSTFKLVTLAGAVEEGLFDPNDKYVSGSIQVPGRRLHDWELSGWGTITYLEGLKRSSNVAFVKLGLEKLGQERLSSYISKFGFGQKTGIDIPGELSGIVNMKYPAEFATSTYGQGLTVTAIQQTAAYGVVANGGKLMWPHVVKDIVNPTTGEVVQSFEPKVVRQVVSEKTAQQVTEYLEQVVSDQSIGTGRKAYIDGYRVAGKTGTANKVNPGEKGYAENKWVVSFAGYAPIEDPRILLTIIADDPDIGGNWHRGGEIGPPAFKEIVTQTLHYLGVPSSTQQMKATDKDSKMSVPNLNGLSFDQAKAAVNKYGVSVEAIGNGPKVVDQFPDAGTEVGVSQHIYIVMQEDGAISIPNMTGKSVRDALEICSFLKVQCVTSGEGYVASQSLSGEGDSAVLNLELKPFSELMQELPALSKDAKSQETAQVKKKAPPGAVKPQNTAPQNAAVKKDTTSGSDPAKKVAPQNR
ncbi:penicillin-binding transpeptidase domain-containing protein [Paenibacillus thalictri]|uniref:PASTA domain-containing protein n=1 Tax=Paenibacillus thalictri TaxID=2527873 RepID=A0A4Q9DSC7_9BACL|nr:penicillin-binding transpeptidase domain-containing protein [Paenibacillus thalictri]TBL78149.1 PASTA domain-containing protein [Paenibacillus thalictri]